MTERISEITARHTYGTWRAQRGWKPLTKLIDEYHFARYRKLPPHFN